MVYYKDGMKIPPRTLIYSGVAALLLWFVYTQRAVLTPFFLAAGFAYILNPPVNFLSHKIRLPRGLSILIVYLAIIVSLGYLALVAGTRLARESEDFTRETRYLIADLETQTQTLPDFLQEPAMDTIESVRLSVQLAPRRVIPYFPGALSKTINVFIFFFAAFYFLKDGRRMIDGLENLLPADYKVEAEVILRRINQVLGSYLRGQLLLVLIMSTLTFIGLSILGVRYALIVALFTGFAELVPFVGPAVAAGVAIFVAYFDGVASFGLPPVYEMITVGAMYFLLRELEDLFIIPQVLSRITRLHPLVVLLAVLAGGHIFGAIGFIAAVPLTAALKIVLEYALEKTG